MHRLIQDHLEEVLRETDGCGWKTARRPRTWPNVTECREEVAAMRRHAAAAPYAARH